MPLKFLSASQKSPQIDQTEGALYQICPQEPGYLAILYLAKYKVGFWRKSPDFSTDKNHLIIVTR